MVKEFSGRNVLFEYQLPADYIEIYGYHSAVYQRLTVVSIVWLQRLI